MGLFMLRRRRLSSTTIKKKSKHVSNEASDFWADQVLILSKASNKTVLSLPAPVLSAQRWEYRRLRVQIQVQCCFGPERSQGILRTRSLERPPRLSHSSWALSVCVQVQCCLTSTETTRLGREPRTATLTFTQLLSSELKAKIDDVHR